MPTATEKIIKPYWFQERTLDSEARYMAMLGGTGAGKTWWGPVWLANRIALDQKEGIEEPRYLALAPTADMARDILAPLLIEHYAGTNLEGTYWRQSHIYDLPTGAKIFVRSADNPHRIEGHHFRAVWADEPAQMKALIWPIIQARSGYHRAPVLFTGYPIAMNWYYHDLYLPWKSGDPDYEMIEFSSIDNPEYPKEEYERAKRTLPGWLFDMRYDGKFRKPFGLVYPEFGSHLFVEPFEIPEDWPVYVGLDPGVFYGGLFLAWNDGVYYAYAEHYTEILASAEKHAEDLLGKVCGVPMAWIYDPARLTDVNELVQHGIGPLVPANNAVLAGVGTVTGIIKSKRVKVMRGRCPNFVDQMEKYSFPVDPVTGNIARENPIKKDDHLPDCFRYIVHTLEGTAVEKETEVVVHEEDYEISRY